MIIDTRISLEDSELIAWNKSNKYDLKLRLINKSNYIKIIEEGKKTIY